MGESRYVNLFSWAESAYPGKVAARFAMDHALAHQIYAGADMFLMPSQFEPCGLSQLISLRYGTVPIVRETGGLRDTVLSYNEYTGDGNGFSFFNYNAHDMLNTINRAIRFYHNEKDIWHKLMKRGMTGDYSWTNSAGKYLELYRALLGNDNSASAEGDTSDGDAEANPSTVETPVEAPAEPVTEPAPVEEAPVQPAEEAPAEPVAAPAEPVEAPAEAPVKPARKPRGKKAAAPAETAEAPAKPARKPRAKKAEVTEAPAETTEAPAKPARKPRAKKAEVTEAPAATTEAPAKPARKPRAKKAEAPKAE